MTSIATNFLKFKKICPKKKEITNLRCIYISERRSEMKLKLSLLGMVVFLCFTNIVFAKTTTERFERSFIGSYSYVDSHGHYGNFEHFTREDDGETSYCIEPGVSFSSKKYDGYQDLSLKEMAKKVSLDEEELQMISLYAYFGYGYKKHKGDEWIVATQAKIWEELGSDFDFTKQYNLPKEKIKTPSEIKEKMETLEELVDEYLEMPKFTATNPQIFYHESYNFGALNGFEVKECQNCISTITDGELIVIPNSKESGKVLLEKTLEDYDEDFIVYASSDGQNLMTPGNVSPLESSVTFDVVSGKLLLKKYDEDTKSCEAKEGGSLKGSVYKLYKEDGTFLSDLTIGEDCSASIEDLELGTYYVQEYQAGLHYELDVNKYYFTITKEEAVKELVVYDKMYQGQVKLIKKDADTKSCQSISPYASLVGAEYGLFTEEGEKLDTLVIQDDCTSLSKRNLLLGNYYLQELKAPQGYQLDSTKHPFTITKENASELLEIEVWDAVFKTELELHKTYLHFNIPEDESDATFVILDAKTMEEVATLKTDNAGFASVNLLYGEYIIRQVSGQAGYHFIEDTYFMVDENSEEVTTLSFLNEPYHGTLEVLKTDVETGKPLPGVFMEVYNEKEELVYQGFTNEEGKLIVENLCYGNYYVIEKEALEGYQLSSIKFYFSIEKDLEVVQVLMENEKIVEVPETKQNVSFFSMPILTLFFGIVGFKKKW